MRVPHQDCHVKLKNVDSIRIARDRHIHGDIVRYL